MVGCHAARSKQNKSVVLNVGQVVGTLHQKKS